MKKFKLFFVVIVLSVAILSCGQKGELYIPKSNGNNYLLDARSQSSD
ncbi:MAG: lipoprotein [Gammaproteobacteria bacterium]